MSFALSHIDPTVPTTFSGTFNDWSPEFIRYRFEVAHPGAILEIDTVGQGRLNFVSMSLAPDSVLRTAEYKEFNEYRESANQQRASRISSGTTYRAQYPRVGLNLIVQKDAVANPISGSIQASPMRVSTR